MKKSMMLVLAAGAIVLAGACSKKDAGSERLADAAGAGQASGAAVQKAEAAERGWIQVKNADLAGHEVRKAGSAEKVEQITALQSIVALPAGRYDVIFGRSVWPNVEVKAKETTVLAAGSLVVKHAALAGHDVVEAGTGAVQGQVSATTSNITLIPGRYEVKFGPLVWPVEVRGAETATLDPGIVTVSGAHYLGHKIYSSSGEVVGQISNIMSSIPLPPGDYVIELGGAKIPFTLKEGERRAFENKAS